MGYLNYANNLILISSFDIQNLKKSILLIKLNYSNKL